MKKYKQERKDSKEIQDDISEYETLKEKNIKKRENMKKDKIKRNRKKNGNYEEDWN